MPLLRNSQHNGDTVSEARPQIQPEKLARTDGRIARNAMSEEALCSYVDAREKVRHACYRLGRLLVELKRDDEAQPLLSEALGAGAAEVLVVYLRRAERMLSSAKKNVPGCKAKALQMFGEIVKNCGENTQEHPSVLRAADVIAMHLLYDEGDRKQAETLFRRVACAFRSKAAEKKTGGPCPSTGGNANAMDEPLQEAAEYVDTTTTLRSPQISHNW